MMERTAPFEIDSLSPMSRVVFLFSVALAALAALFVSAMNAGRVEVELAFLRIATPLGLALVVAFVAGLVAGLI